jgi:hypothetical protein
MTRLILRLTLGVLLVAGALSVAAAQDKDSDTLDEFRRLRRLDSPLDFWNAVQFEVDLGKTDIAARFLRGLLDKKPTDKDLHAILDKDGITAIMRLRGIRVWSADKKENDQALKDAESLITLATEANKKRLADDARIRELIGQLSGTPEERTYATGELYKIGAAAVPHLLDYLSRAKGSTERDTLKQTLKRMGPATLPPLLAALDTNDTLLKLDVLDVLRQRHASRGRDVTPWLYYLSAAKTEPALVRARATKILSDFLELPESRLPSAKVALTREAERYYDHKVAFGDPKGVTVWRWDANKPFPARLSPEAVTASYAEHYYGQRFAGQALALDPDYRPAQLVALSFAVDKAMEKAAGAAVSRGSPEASELLAKASPELVMDMLDRALKESRTGVALAAVRSLGDRAEARAKRPGRGGEPGLVRALYYPDPRVQFAAAQALLNIPGAPAPKTATRIVEVLARALSPAAAYVPGPKVLVALADEDMRDRVRQAVLDAGAKPVLVSNGKDAMRQLRADSTIEAILLDSTLPFPGLANTLAQMRQDVDVGKLPVLLSAVPETRASHDAAVRFRAMKGRRDLILSNTRPYREMLRRLAEEEARDKAEVEKDFAAVRSATALDDKLNAYRRVEELYKARREKLDQENAAAVAALKDVPGLEAEMAREVQRYDLEAQVREAALERYVQRCRYENVRVIHTSLLVNAKGLDATVLGSIREAGVALTEADKREAAEQAMELLANLAEGKPAGYDVQPVADTILAALRAGRLGPDGQKAAIRAAARLNGPAAQATLATVVRDGSRSAELRLAASRALIVNVQRQGSLLPAAEVNALEALARQDGLDARLKDQLHNFAGALRPSERSTGERLRDFRPAPAAPQQPPAKEKDKDADKP